MFMTKSEQIAFNFLKKNGWNPEKVKPYKYAMYYDEESRRVPTGTPDFRCSDKRFVEVKTPDNCFFNRKQIEMITKIHNDGYKVYVVMVDNKTEYILGLWKLTPMSSWGSVTC
jgi:hypothetical protein